MADQRNESYVKNMDEAYRQKHYPDGSVFKAFKKSLNGTRGFLGLFFIGLFFAGSMAGFIWSIIRILQIMRDNEEGIQGFDIVFSVFFLLLALVFGAALFLLTKDMRKTTDDWIRSMAKAGGLSEQELREFDRQAMEADSLILYHLGKLKSSMIGQMNGILTRDYICLYGGNVPTVMKLEHLTGAYLKEKISFIKVGRRLTETYSLTIDLQNKDNKTAYAQTSEESAHALQELLKSRCPGIDTADGAVMP